MRLCIIQLKLLLKMPLHFILSQKGVRQLFHNNYIYRHDKSLSGGNEAWKCIEYRVAKCAGRAHTTGMEDNSDILFASTMEGRYSHNNLPQPVEAEKRRIQNQVKRTASSCNDPPANVIAPCTTDISSAAVSAALPSISAMKRKVQRIRKTAEMVPANPADINNLVILPPYQVTLTK